MNQSPDPSKFDLNFEFLDLSRKIVVTLQCHDEDTWKIVSNAAEMLQDELQDELEKAKQQS